MDPFLTFLMAVFIGYIVGRFVILRNRLTEVVEVTCGKHVFKFRVHND